MCFFTLALFARGLVEIPDDLVMKIFETVREAALQFNHATLQAAELRDVVPPRVPTEEFAPVDIGDDLATSEATIQKAEGHVRKTEGRG